MVFSLLIILFIGIIAFFHYVQGFFSATISAMICVLAAVLAVSYDETVVNLLLKGKMADYAHGMVLCMIFAVVYIVLRLIFDKAIPGNVRTPSTVDKVGAGLMGLVAGIFCTGIFAIGVEMLPWDPSISFMGAQRFKLEDKKDVYVPMQQGQSKDSFVYGALSGNTLTPDKDNPLAMPAEMHTLYVPVDDWVINTVYHLSDGGSLAGDKTLASVHPDYLTEIFGERLGIQFGGRHATLNINGAQNIDIPALFTVASLPCFDGQLPDLRPAEFKPLYKMESLPKAKKDDPTILKGVVTPAAHQRILVVRVKVKGNASDDTDDLYRFSTGSIHLSAIGNDQKTYKDFYPIGTLENGSAVFLNSPDDFLFCKKDAGFDLVFVVDEQVLTGQKDIKIEPGTSITIKRLSDLDLSNAEVTTSLTSDPDNNPIRNLVLMDRLKTLLPPAAPTVAAAPAPANQGSPNNQAGGSPSVGIPAPVTTPQIQPGKPIADDISGVVSISFKATGLTSISTADSDENKQDAAVAGGTISLKGGKISIAKVDPIKSLSELAAGDNSYTQLYCPSNRTIVQIAVHPYQATWDWLDQLGSIRLNDSLGNSTPPNGFYQLVKTASGRGLSMRYNATSTHIEGGAVPNGTPDGDLYFIFLIPSGTDVKSFAMGGKTQDLSSPVHVP